MRSRDLQKKNALKILEEMKDKAKFSDDPETSENIKVWLDSVIKEVDEFFSDESKKPGEMISFDCPYLPISYYVKIVSEETANEEEKTEKLISISLEKHVIPNNKLSNLMTEDNIINKEEFEFLPFPSNKEIKTICLLNYEGDKVKLSGRQPFTEYDRNVYNAVCSLCVYGHNSHVFTPAMVFRAMTGQRENEKPTPNQIEAITNSLDKMRFIRVIIKCTAELQKYKTPNSKQINGGEIDTYLLTAESIKVTAGSQTVKAYKVLKTPILYDYSHAVGQVLTVPSRLLDIKKIDKNGNITTNTLPNTETRILIKGYLIRKIEGMKGKNKLDSDIITLCDYTNEKGELCEGLYTILSENGEPNGKQLDKIQSKRIRDDVEKMLKFWQKDGYITNYRRKYKNKQITGYIITV